MNRRTQVLLEALDKYLTESTTMKVIEIIAESRLDEISRNPLTWGPAIAELWPIAKQYAVRAGEKSAEFVTNTAIPATQRGWRWIERAIGQSPEAERIFVQRQAELFAEELKINPLAKLEDSPGVIEYLRASGQTTMPKALEELYPAIKQQADAILKNPKANVTTVAKQAEKDAAAAQKQTARQQAEAEKNLTQQQRDAKRAQERAEARTDKEKAAQRKHELDLAKAEKEIAKAKANTTHTANTTNTTNTTNRVSSAIASRFGTPGGITEGLGWLKTTWLIGNGALALGLLAQPIKKYYDDMEGALDGLHQGATYYEALKATPGALEEVTTKDGTAPQNVEEWFVMYNHKQAERLMATMVGKLGGAMLYGAVGLGLFSLVGKFIPGVTAIGNAVTPAIFNSALAGSDDNPKSWILVMVMHNIFYAQDAARTGSDLYAQFNLPSAEDAIARYNAAVEKINKGVKADKKQSQADDARLPGLDAGEEEVAPGTATNQGAKPQSDQTNGEPAAGTTPGGATVSGDWK